MNKLDLEESKVLWICLVVVLVGRLGGSEEEVELDFRNFLFDFGGMLNGFFVDEEIELGWIDLFVFVLE